ncbi:cupin domain-containing protein [Dyadobacter fermentans]|uniref:Cupin 2 conserved barrel domain protein n=1 Tax=Dyadobacter fermentans (strain ATCC 700827 / DSM 18053 / CIP 107007 / KCTC 52180 / NS114) TaxID=471854 RepID=C6VW21_DYAFD|nr:cupin domain-containing protein [Dyadobacter fermentans]ACT93153.1 Cupin 2 conserved barrel domain protein [Dyadobacter fermentans DSM 18053]
MKVEKEVICLGHRIIPHQTSGSYDLIEGISAPGVPGPPPHYHSKYHEVFVVTEGALEFLIDGNPVTVKAGESIDIPANTLHTFTNQGESNCRYLNIHSPKGFLGLFETFGVDASEQHAFEKSVAPDVISRVLQRATDFDMHIIVS